MPGEQDIAGLLAKEKLAERERQEFTKKIEGIGEQVADIRKNMQEGMKRVEAQVKSVLTSKTDSETLKRWPTLTEAEKQVSPLIPQNAFGTMLDLILAQQENIPGLKRRVAELLTKEDAEKLLSDDPSGTVFAEAICTSESCKTKVKERVETFSKEHGLKKEKRLFD